MLKLRTATHSPLSAHLGAVAVPSDACSPTHPTCPTTLLLVHQHLGDNWNFTQGRVINADIGTVAVLSSACSAARLAWPAYIVVHVQ